MAILVITTDLKCCRCKTKINKVLDSLRGKFCIQKVEYDEKKNVVVVRGTFDAEKLRKKIWCKACKVITNIIIVKVWPPPPTPPPTPPPNPPPTPPPPPKIEYKLVPYPYPLPYPMACQGTPWKCLPQQCRCCSKPPSPPPPPPPPPSLPKPCECSQHHHEHGDCGRGCRTPQPPCGCSNHGDCRGRCKTPPPWPQPWCEYKLACEDSPSPDCSIM